MGLAPGTSAEATTDPATAAAAMATAIASAINGQDPEATELALGADPQAPPIDPRTGEPTGAETTGGEKPDPNARMVKTEPVAPYVVGGLGGLAAALTAGFFWYRRRLP
jgi:hypothetical protein